MVARGLGHEGACFEPLEKADQASIIIVLDPFNRGLSVPSRSKIEAVAVMGKVAAGYESDWLTLQRLAKRLPESDNLITWGRREGQDARLGKGDLDKGKLDFERVFSRVRAI
jgi:hypothetical protein